MQFLTQLFTRLVLCRPYDHGDRRRFGFSGRVGVRRRADHRNHVNDHQCRALAQDFNESLPSVRRAREISGAEVPILWRRPFRLDPVSLRAGAYPLARAQSESALVSKLAHKFSL
jgi:hypothetical protein